MFLIIYMSFEFRGENKVQDDSCKTRAEAEQWICACALLTRRDLRICACRRVTRINNCNISAENCAADACVLPSRAPRADPRKHGWSLCGSIFSGARQHHPVQEQHHPVRRNHECMRQTPAHGTAQYNGDRSSCIRMLFVLNRF